MPLRRSRVRPPLAALCSLRQLNGMSTRFVSGRLRVRPSPAALARPSPSRERHLPSKQTDAGSNPAGRSTSIGVAEVAQREEHPPCKRRAWVRRPSSAQCRDGSVAHLGERRFCIAEARGSTPLRSTRGWRREEPPDTVILAAAEYSRAASAPIWIAAQWLSWKSVALIRRRSPVRARPAQPAGNSTGVSETGPISRGRQARWVRLPHPLLCLVNTCACSSVGGAPV